MSGIGIAAGCKPVASAFLVQVQVGSPLVLASDRRIYDYKLIKICRALCRCGGMVDTYVLGTYARACGFESLHRHHSYIPEIFCTKKIFVI